MCNLQDLNSKPAFTNSKNCRKGSLIVVFPEIFYVSQTYEVTVKMQCLNFNEVSKVSWLNNSVWML